MKNTILLKFLEFLCCGHLFFGNNVKSGFKLDFSQEKRRGSGYSSPPGKWGLRSIVSMLMLFLFSNFVSAQIPPPCINGNGIICIDGDPIDWNASNFSNFPLRSYELDHYGSGVVDDQYTQGSKDFFQAGGSGSGYLVQIPVILTT